MSSEGGVGGIGGGGGAHVGGVAGAGSGASQAVTPVKGASGVSDDGGKGSMAIGDGNIVGNTQTQTVNNNTEINIYESMGSKDFCSLQNMGGPGEQSPLEGISEMSSEDLQKMLAIMLILKLLEMLMEDGASQGQQAAAGQGLEAAMSTGIAGDAGAAGASAGGGADAGGGGGSGGGGGGGHGASGGAGGAGGA